MNAVNSSRRCLSIQQGLFKPIQIGLTGSIGMGKSSVAKHFNNLGFPVFDADSAVHELYSKDGEAVYPLSKIVPDAIVDSSVDRKILGMKILQNDRLLKDIEEIVHPLVAKKRNLFLEACRSKGCFLVVYDIPLLLENVQNYSVDYIVVVSASAETQRSRVLSRPGMTIEKFESILSKQMPDHEKQKRAHFVISTDYPDYASARSQICKIIESIVKEKYDIWTQFLSNCNYYHNNKVIIKQNRRNEISDYFDFVVFDLDDTLIPTLPPLIEAKRALINYLKDKLPRTHDAVVSDELTKEIKRVYEEFPLISHDLTEIRRLALTRLSKQFDEYNQSVIDEAIEVFIYARSNVDHYLYEDVLSCLNWFREQGIRIAVLTNGNANLALSEQLNFYLTLSLTASEIGIMKPSPVPFLALLQRLNAQPSRTLFIGDSYVNDVVGAKNCGMCAALLDRSSSWTSASSASSIDRDITGLNIPNTDSLNMASNPDLILNSLDPAHISEIILKYLNKLEE